MPTEFKLPDLGENIESAGVIAVLVKPGDAITQDTPVLEIETDKATLEVPSTVSGRVQEVFVKAGDKAQVGQVVLTVEEVAGVTVTAPAPVEVAKAPVAAPAAPAAAVASRQVVLPDLGENITSVTVLAVLVKLGEVIQAETSILEIETDKATIEVPAGAAGRVEAILVQAGEKAQVGQAVLELQASVQAPSPESRPVATVGSAALSPPPARAETARPSNGTPKVAPSKPAAEGRPAAASPTVRRLAREIGVDIQQVKGSGPRGRIRHEDVKLHARLLLRTSGSRPVAQAPVGGWTMPAPALPDFSKFGPIEREAMSTIRKKTAQNMAQAWSTIPMVTQFDRADITELETLRKKLDAKSRQQGIRLTVTAILVKICASALKRFPKFNASLDLQKEEVVFKKFFNIGVAVDTERGLLVPVLKGVESQNILEISDSMQKLAEKARNRKVTPDDLQGSCFTITNLGGIGGTSFTPIVNPPEVGILGVSRSSLEPVWQEGQFVPRNLLPLSLTYDHRLIDGAEAARFLRFVCEALENPALLLFEG